MPEFRRDPIIGRWIIIATERGKRPVDFKTEKEQSLNGFCPFCYGHEDKTPAEIVSYRNHGTKPNTEGWWVRVVPNKFPALQIEGSLSRVGEGMYDKMNGIGAHEVIIETPDHRIQLHQIEDKKLEDILWVYRDRTVDLKRDKRFEYILIFKNYGVLAGASLSHPHSQLIATPVVPKRVIEELSGGKSYFDYKERCVFCDMIQQEKSDELRIVLENDDFIAFEPYASRFPFETWILPKVHSSEFEDIQKGEVENLARMLKEINRKISKVLDDPPYNYILHNSPLRENGLPHFHWHIEIIPKLTKVAGFEWGTDFYINPTPPEDAAKFLREE